ncbi:MAG: M28 family peptidase [Anaerolineaceae bacterium]
MKNSTRWIIALAIMLLVGTLSVLILFNLKPGPTQPFNADRAWQDVLAQMDMGPRTPGSEAHDQVVIYIQTELEKAGWKVEIQETERMGHPVRNIIAKRGSGSPWVIFGAHYDSRFVADQDPVAAHQSMSVPGANDGASGVAVLLEMARILPKDSDKQVWLVFFDAEDQGRIEGWDWILGSRAFADSLTAKPDAVVVVDMIGDADLNIYREKSSDKVITDSIWQTAADLGYSEQFINEEKYNILDDHLPFLELGIPAVDIIDFDYPYWHTTSDTHENIAQVSLAIVGNTLLAWLEGELGLK